MILAQLAFATAIVTRSEFGQLIRGNDSHFCH